MKLYYMPTCPYCQKVLKTFESLKLIEGKDFTLADIGEEKNHQELLKLGGEDQVPFLVDGKTMMYESDDIIEYVKKKVNYK
ncbi:MAG TPA: glutathione S-transferase N-terminal domain-containing protein [Candidatus Nanoarchaeia archaeon]|nr:glutathione S-transferase N-terminal domain-containing protein [Candidatus Nanoarchaeia archaeon]